MGQEEGAQEGKGNGGSSSDGFLLFPPFKFLELDEVSHGAGNE